VPWLGQLHQGAKVILMDSRWASIGTNQHLGGSLRLTGCRRWRSACRASDVRSDSSPGGLPCPAPPGLVSTRMDGFSEQGITAEQAWTGLLARIDALSLETSVALDCQLASSCPGEAGVVPRAA